MTLKNFITKHRLRINKKTVHACNEAISIMSKSPDLMHDTVHIESILDSLNKFKSESSEIKWNQVNYNILLLSICWHDIWKSQRFPANRKKAVFHQLAEGLGSMRQFDKFIKKYQLDSQTIRRVKYAIRKHSMFQILPTNKSNIEARILQDLDKLDTWKPARVTRGLDNMRRSGSITPAFINLFNLYFKYYMLPKSKRANFTWTIHEMQNHRHNFFLQIKDLIVDFSGPKAGHDFFQLHQKTHTPLFRRIYTRLAKIIS